MADSGSTSIQRLLLFGGSGSIGTTIRDRFCQEGWTVSIVSRSASPDATSIQWNPVVHSDGVSCSRAINKLVAQGPFDAVCWAQGMNCTDSVYDFDQARHEAVYDANVLYILNSMNILLTQRLLRRPARLCVISSIWQDMARQTKLSYCVTKAALQGLVLSAAADLARDGHVINAVLPGVIDTPMTRANLKMEQVRKVEDATLFGRLPTLDEVAACVFGLCRADTTGVTGQFISVDLGYSRVRVV
ncbi:SDR family NAD(P)-dependent oxidoreductase [Serpentinimonas maccroryi]|uniref:SDR family NAD(P)-dependent oxidoreductase n=1 Tax=Serpentinimonas maccroryi TaxID=1458426 RepID=UPI0018D4D143|nr:SDR family oxidoreductase [Serpentinimonas maccroryi]